MPKLTARRLLRTLHEAPSRRGADFTPLNFDKWRGTLRDIRNQLIKLRDKAEDEVDRLDIDDAELPPSEQDKVEKLSDRMELAVDSIAEAINQIDLCL